MDDLFNKAAVTEYKTAATQIATHKTALVALKKSFARYDNLIATSVDESSLKPACKAGCAYCCYYKVEVRAHEMFVIKEHMQAHWTQPQIDKILAEAEGNATFIKTLTQEQHLVTNIKCPFLIDNNCSIYPVRPYKCRNFHATDASACEESFNDPGNLTIENSFVESIAMFGNAHSQGFEKAIKNSGLDSRAYDLNTALIEVFAEASAIKRFKKGKKTFLQAIEVIEDI